MNDFKLSGEGFEPHASSLYENSNVINVSKPERFFSVAAGVALYMVAKPIRNRYLQKILSGGALYFLYRGISGNCPASAMLTKSRTQHTQAINIRTSFYVNAPRQMVYDTWRNLEKLPHFLKHIKKIKVIDVIHSHWVLKTPGSIPSVEWNAEIIEQEDARELSWRSLPGSMIETAGKINFEDVNTGTQLFVLITYRPPAGYIGAAIAKLVNPALKSIIERDLIGFKNYIENKAMQ